MSLNSIWMASYVGCHFENSEESGYYYLAACAATASVLILFCHPDRSQEIL